MYKTLTFPATTLADLRHVTKCHNLRPSPSGGLQAVGLPGKVASLPGAVPVNGGSFPLADGTGCLLVYHQGELKAVIGSVILTIAPLAEAPSCALAVDGGVIVMPANGRPIRYTFSRGGEDEGGEWTVAESPLFPGLPPLMIVRRDMGSISSKVSSFLLDSSYTTTTEHLTEDDQDTVDYELRAAYRALSRQATLHGRYIQPVLAYYKLIGYNGETLYTSAPVLVGPESGLQAVTATLGFTGEGFRRSEEGSLTATEFIPAIAVTREPDREWHALVRSVHIFTSTSEVFAYSTSILGTCSRVDSTASRLTLKFNLPGVNPLKPYAAEGGMIAHFVKSMLSNLDHWTIRDLPLSNLASCETRRNLAAVQSIPSPTPESTLASRLSAPHSFTASACARSGDLIAWGGLKALPFDGYSLPEMTVTKSDTTGSVPTAVLVKMRDGSSVVRAEVIAKSTPTGLSPLLLYPSADAESMTLMAGSKAVTLPLSPSPCGKWSYYLAPDLKPIRFTDDKGGFALPAASPAVYDYPSALMVAHESAPLEPLAVSFGDSSAVNALLPAVRHSNSFTVPSARFYVLGAGGISSMTLSHSRRRINLNLLDGRGVASPEAATLIPGGIAVIASGALLTVTGSRPSTLREHCRSDKLGWCGRYGELWCIDSSGARDVTVLSADGKVEYTRDRKSVV